MQPQNRLVLLGRPRALFEGWVQVVTPALAALFAGTPREHGRDTCPVLAAVLADELDELLILASAPWPCASDRPGGAASANTRARGQRTCEPPTTSRHRGRRSKQLGRCQRVVVQAVRGQGRSGRAHARVRRAQADGLCPADAPDGGRRARAAARIGVRQWPRVRSKEWSRTHL